MPLKGETFDNQTWIFYYHNIKYFVGIPNNVSCVILTFEYFTD